MAAVAPSTSAQPTPTQADPLGVVPPLSWEGDKMFNIYIYDYCFKRGFRKTARELMAEAEIPSDATPPINARQGLLFEWWSVFWVLFQAKSSGGGSDDGLAYIQHQQAQRANQRITQAPLPLGTQPAQPPPQPQNMSRLPNGMPTGNMQPGMTRPPSAYLNGQMTNGVGMNPAMGGQPQPGQPMGSMNFGGMSGPHPPPQPNGIAGPHGPGGPQQQQQQIPGVPNGPPMQFGMMPGQRQPMMNGISPPQQQQQRPGPPNGGGPYHGSPTMAHSPQHNAGAPGRPGQPQQPGQPPQQGQPGPQQPGGPGQQAPMSQLGPSPHMANRVGGMLPPNGMGAPMNPGQQPQQLQHGGPPTPGFQQQQQPPNSAGRPPSRTNTPRSGMMTHPSPSLASRQTPGGPPPGMGPGPMVQGGMPQQMPMPGMSQDPNQEIMQIPQNQLNTVKHDLGLGDKDISTLNTTEKNQILNLWKTTRMKDSRGPSGMIHAPGQPGQQQQQRPGPGPGTQQQRGKRSSTSPGEEHETLPRNESSPPDRKRMRRSPADPPYPHPGQPQQPGLPPQGHPQQQQQLGPPGQPGQPPNMNQPGQMVMRPPMMNGGMPMPMSMGGPPGGQLQRPQQPQQHGGQPMPMQQHPQLGMSSMPPGSHMMTPGQQQQQRADSEQANRERMFQQQHMKGPGGPDNNNIFGMNPGGSGQFPSSPLIRVQNKPPQSGMMPPPPPGMGEPQKDNRDGGPGKGPGPSNPQNGQQQQQQTHNPDGSPRNQTPGGPSGSGTAPPTPVPVNQPNPQQQPQQQQVPPPPPPNQNHLNMMLGLPSSGMGADMSIFDPSNFMADLGAEFDPSLFRPDGDINFERDFGQWFNPDESNGLGSGLDMKMPDEPLR